MPANSGLMPDRSRRDLLIRRALAWSLGWLFAGALYLLLIDITDLPELIVGAGAAVLAATGLELAREQRVAGENIRTRWLGRAYRPLLKVPSDVWHVSVAAIVQLARGEATVGEFRAVRFRCGDDESLESGRRGLAEGFGSLAPNTIIVGVDPERELILAHQLRRSGGREAIDLLELG
jgi:hypothetical protein